MPPTIAFLDLIDSYEIDTKESKSSHALTRIPFSSYLPLRIYALPDLLNINNSFCTLKIIDKLLFITYNDK